MLCVVFLLFFFFNDTATTEIYTSFPTRRSSDLDLEIREVVEAPEGADKPYTGEGKILNSDKYDGLDSAAAREKIVAEDRKSTRLNSSHANISYAVFCLKKKKKQEE